LQWGLPTLVSSAAVCAGRGAGQAGAVELAAAHSTHVTAGKRKVWAAKGQRPLRRPGRQTSYLTRVGEEPVSSWPVQDAKARFSELLDTCLREGPQIVTKRGTDTAVLVPITEWQRLQQEARPTLKDLLLADHPRADIPVPTRGKLRHRAPPRFD
jgi:prevent-host-death family protein